MPNNKKPTFEIMREENKLDIECDEFQFYAVQSNSTNIIRSYKSKKNKNGTPVGKPEVLTFSDFLKLHLNWRGARV